MRKILVFTVGLRVLVTAFLLFSPFFNEPAELQGWDVARFQEIEDSPGRAYVNFEVEYPPGSVLLISAVTSLDDGPNRLVTSHRVLVITSLLVDLALAAILHRFWGQRVGVAYLVLGSPLVAFGLVRFDLWATLLAVTAAAALRCGAELGDSAGPKNTTNLRKDNNTWASPSPDTSVTARPLALDLLAAAAIVGGASIKLWPALLIIGALAINRRRAAAIAALGGSLTVLVWLKFSGTDALFQILSLRDATGWQIESIAGSLTALLTDAQATLEADAFRIGTINQTLVIIGRMIAAAALVTLGWLGWRYRAKDQFALIILGSVAALIVTAPLLSPQFLLWLTPWAAILANSASQSNGTSQSNRVTRAVFLTGGAVALTAIVLIAAGPPNLHHPLPSLLLLLRDGLLAAIVIQCGLALRPGTRIDPGSASKPTDRSHLADKHPL